MRDALKKALTDAAVSVDLLSQIPLANGDLFDVAAHTVTSDGIEHTLTNKEYMMIRLLEEKMPNPLSYAELGQNIWNNDETSSYDKIQNIIKRIRKKSPTLITSGYKINLMKDQ